MVDETGTEPGSDRQQAAGPSSSLRREKPIIEGEIASEKKTGSTLREGEPGPDGAETSPSPENAGHAGHLPHSEAPNDQPAGADSPHAGPGSATPQHRFSPVWPIAAAVVIGAAIAGGGAYFLRSFDTAPEDFAALSAREAELADRLAALEKKPDPDAGLHEALEAQDRRLAAVETAVREAIGAAKSAQDAASQAAAAQTSAQQSAAPADSSPAAAAPPQPPVDLSPLTAKVSDLDQRLGSLDDKLAKLSAPLAPKNEMRLAEDSAVQPSAHIEAEAAAIMAESLVGKVESGAGFKSELAALANRGADKAKLAQLEPAAAAGVPTAHALAQQFSALSPGLLAVEQPKPEGSFWDRLTQNAARLVHIRKVGDLTGDDLPARVGRINAALQAGAVGDALAEWNELPASAKAKSQAFGDAAKLRVDAIAAARALETEAIAALAKSKS
jgi:hypothetical protein